MQKVSPHECRVYRVFTQHKGTWFTNRELAEQIGAGIAERTVRAYTLRFLNLGLVEQARVFPAFRFRWKDEGEKRNAGHIARLKAAADLFGI